MIRRLLAVPLLAATCTAILAQGGAEAAKKAGQEQRSVEALRTIARAKVQEMQAVFQDQLADGLRILRRTPADSDTEAAEQIRKDLAPWASVFPERFIELIVEAEDKPDLRAHLVDVLTLAGSSEAATALAQLIGKGDRSATADPTEVEQREYLDMICVQGIGFIPSATDEVRKVVVGLTGTTKSDRIMGAALISLARLGCPEAAAIARETLGGDAPPTVKARAVAALAITQDDPRSDARLIRKLGQDKAAPKVLRVAVLRALARYEKNPDGRRLLHDALEEEDLDIMRAALFALKRVASKDSSKVPLLKLVKTITIDRDLRDDAARILMKLGSKDGARHLVDPLKRTADGERGNANLQRTAADAYYDLHDYDDAIVYYRRAVNASNPARRYQHHVSIAKCHARVGDFDKAVSELKKAGYDRLTSFSDDPAFEKMRAHPKWAPLFEEK